MIIKLKWRKIVPLSQAGKCWYCEAKTNRALYFPDNSEIWCCSPCYKRHGRIIKRDRSKQQEKLKISDNNEGENAQKDAVMGVSGQGGEDAI